MCHEEAFHQGFSVSENLPVLSGFEQAVHVMYVCFSLHGYVNCTAFVLILSLYRAT